jgi:hypothetical protein
MIITKQHLQSLWYENDEGEKWYQDPDDQEMPTPPDGFYYQFSRFSHILRESSLYIIPEINVRNCKHPAKHIKSTGGWIDGSLGRECKLCGGTQVKEWTEEWAREWDSGKCVPWMGGNSSWSEDLVMNIANSGDYKLGDAIIIAATCCERCLNVLCYNYKVPSYDNPDIIDGYAEGSEEWKKCGTSCRFCENGV